MWYAVCTAPMPQCHGPVRDVIWLRLCQWGLPSGSLQNSRYNHELCKLPCTLEDNYLMSHLMWIFFCKALDTRLYGIHPAYSWYCERALPYCSMTNILHIKFSRLQFSISWVKPVNCAHLLLLRILRNVVYSAPISYELVLHMILLCSERVWCQVWRTCLPGSPQSSLFSYEMWRLFMDNSLMSQLKCIVV